GASAGIGDATARRIVELGGRVVLNARRAEKLASLCEELGADRAAVVAGDASDSETVDAMLDAAESIFGGAADLVVVNAGVGLNGGVLSSDDTKWESMVKLNVVGAMRLMRRSAERMLSSIEKRGDWQERAHDIVVLGSTVGRHISPFSGSYGATKFAVHGAAEALRREICGKGVRVSVVEPGLVVSEFQAGAGYDPEWFEGLKERFGPVLEPADVAETVVFIASQQARVHLADVLVRATRQDYP
ncbi:MAG: SDR family oxidoreductase, partial [Planctomycetota bacterium]